MCPDEAYPLVRDYSLRGLSQRGQKILRRPCRWPEGRIFLVSTDNMAKRGRIDAEEISLAEAKEILGLLRPDSQQQQQQPELDRSQFWAREQKRWADIITGFIAGSDAYTPWVDQSSGYTIHRKRGLEFLVSGDVLLSKDAMPKIDIMFDDKKDRIRVEIVMPATLWKELCLGWFRFSQQVVTAVLQRSNLVVFCPEVADKTAVCTECGVASRDVSYGELVLCRARKMDAQEMQGQ